MKKKVILSAAAHGDGAEFLAGGTPVKLVEEGLQPRRVTEQYWHSKAHWQSNKLVDISDTMDKKLNALFGAQCQMVLTVDEFIGEAAAAGVDPSQLDQIDPEQYHQWIDLGMGAANSELGQEIGAAYAEAFRYDCVRRPYSANEQRDMVKCGERSNP